MKKITKAIVALTAFGIVMSPVSPALAAPGDEPVPHFSTTSRYLPADSAGTGYDRYNRSDQLITSEVPYATTDVIHMFQGDKIVFRPLHNDNPGNALPEGTDTSQYRFDYNPDDFPFKFDYASLRILDKSTGEYGSTFTIDGELVANVVPAGGDANIYPAYKEFDGSIQPAYNPYNQPFIAITGDNASISSEEIHYQVDIVDENGNYSSTLDGIAYVGAAERLYAYCVSPISGFTQDEYRNPHIALPNSEWFDPNNYAPARGNTTGGGSVPECGVTSTSMTAEVNAGETVFIPVADSATPYNTLVSREYNSSDYFTDASTTVFNDAEGNDIGDTVTTESGVWEKVEGGVNFTALPTASGTTTQTFDISTRWNSPKPEFAENIDVMNKRLGATALNVPINVNITPLLIEEPPVEEIPEEPPVEEIPVEPIIPEEPPVEEEVPVEEIPVVEEEEPVIPVIVEEEPVIPVVIEEEPVVTVLPDVVEPVVIDEPILVDEPVVATPAIIKDGGEDINFLAIGLVALVGIITAFRKKIFA